jgi:hypothetical protein
MSLSKTVHGVPLNGGGTALVDVADRELIAGFEWKLWANGYVGTQRGQMYLYLHRLIAGAGSDDTVDHINQDPLDNRSVNLRICSRSQNSANRGPDRRRLGTSSRHKGVSLHKRSGKWRAYVHHAGRTKYLGTFELEDDAALAYNRAALDVWGEFARLNEVKESAMSACESQ